MQKAKIAACFAGTFLSLALALCVFGSDLVSCAVRFGLERSLPQYQISYKSVRIRRDSLFIYGAQAKNRNTRFDAAEIRISFRLTDLIHGKFSKIDVSGLNAETHGLIVKNLNVSFEEMKGGQLTVEAISYQKLVVSDIQSPIRLEGNILKVEPIHGVALDGTLEGKFHMWLDGDKVYELNLILQQLSLPALISDLKFEDKMSLTGRFLGNISVRGNRLGVEYIDGALTGSDKGGDLVILDETFLGDIAARMNQPLELVKAGLKEYHYDSGQARLLKNGRDLGLDLSMDGPKGKRQLSTVFHDAL